MKKHTIFLFRVTFFAVLIIGLSASLLLARTETTETKHPETEVTSRGYPHPKPLLPQTASPWFNRILIPEAEPQQFTGNWWGARDKLADAGFTVSSSYVFDLLANPVGGKRQGIDYDHSWGLDLNFDLEKLIGWKGAQFHHAWLWRAGRNLSKDYIGNAFTVTSIFGSEEVKMYSLFLEQELFDGRLNVRLGRIAAGDDFLHDEIYWYYMTNGIDGNPISVPLNMPGFSTYPTATWGIRWYYYITEVKNLYSLTGVYNADPRVGRDSAHGMDFSWKLNRGVFFAQEFGYTPNQEKDAEGYPGKYKGGFYINSGKFDDLYENRSGQSFAIDGGLRERHRGNWGFYWLVEQMVYREGEAGGDQGLTPWFGMVLAPDDMNKWPFFFDGGLVYKGLIPGRDHDVAAFGFEYGRASRDLANSQRDNQDIMGIGDGPQDYEMVFEWTYKIAVTPYLYIQPDIQLVINPGARGDTEDAMVIGWRTGITF